jgi:hypothetical protein
MTKDYVYIYGYTNVESLVTEVDTTYHEDFTITKFINILINPLLKNKNLCIQDLSLGNNIISDEYFINCDESFSNVKLFQKINQKGYIYNSYSEKLVYVFFCKKVYNENNFPIEEINDSLFEEKSHVEEVEEINERIKNLSLNPKKDFIEELKQAVKKRRGDNVVIDIQRAEQEKSDFERELVNMIRVRKDRCKKRERKLLLKKRK